MNQNEKRAVENRLIAMGGKGELLQDGDLCAMFARLVEDFPGDKHWFYRGMLNECEPDKRRDMYYSLKAKFSQFVPKPLESYLAELSEQASAMVSHRIMRVEGPEPDAVHLGDSYYKSVPEHKGTHTAIRLTCSKCTKQLVFVGDTLAGAVIAARKKGWIRDPRNDKEICPKCPAIRKKVTVN